ncbi:hypothetical protein KCP75_01325 [Salmonella enterica subsp. enterica]|nr:hypothetical protein KCP75_01325 [Salmonella enterica subsp. enterica]
MSACHKRMDTFHETPLTYAHAPASASSACSFGAQWRTDGSRATHNRPGAIPALISGVILGLINATTKPHVPEIPPGIVAAALLYIPTNLSKPDPPLPFPAPTKSLRRARQSSQRR